MSDLRDVPSRWMVLQRTDPEGRPVVTTYDDPVAAGAPWDGWPLQVGIGLRLRLPDASGQPGLTEGPSLRLYEQAVLDGLAGEGRLVATVTGGGVRELVVYAPDDAFVRRWQRDLPPGLDAYDAELFTAHDPAWTGLRELVDRLEPGERVVRLGED